MSNIPLILSKVFEYFLTKASTLFKPKTEEIIISGAPTKNEYIRSEAKTIRIFFSKDTIEINDNKRGAA